MPRILVVYSELWKNGVFFGGFWWFWMAKKRDRERDCAFFCEEMIDVI